MINPGDFVRLASYEVAEGEVTQLTQDTITIQKDNGNLLTARFVDSEVQILKKNSPYKDYMIYDIKKRDDRYRTIPV